MPNDDDLRSRMERLAQAREVPEVTLDAVEGRSRRHRKQRQFMAVGAVFALVLGAVGVVRLIDDGKAGEVDVATEDVVDEPESTTTTTAVPAAFDAASSESSDSATSIAFPGDFGGPSGSCRGATVSSRSARSSSRPP